MIQPCSIPPAAGCFSPRRPSSMPAASFSVCWRSTPTLHRRGDVTTFIGAAHRFLDGGNPLDLYAQSRAAQTWPYAYPPLHALVTAVALLAGRILSLLPLPLGLPEYVWARLPALLADLGIGLVLYRIVLHRSRVVALARLALVLWLFNPVTFYDTAVQGHFESEWLLCVLLAYVWFDEGRGLVPVSLALAAAVLFKQVALLFAIPLWVYMVTPAGETAVSPSVSPSVSRTRLARWMRLVVSGALAGLVAGAVCLPYLLYSNDFLYMNLTYVENVPVQTQSWDRRAAGPHSHLGRGSDE